MFMPVAKSSNPLKIMLACLALCTGPSFAYAAEVRSIVGVVRDWQGKPVTNAIVVAVNQRSFEEEESFTTTRTDSSGQFSIGLPKQTPGFEASPFLCASIPHGGILGRMLTLADLSAQSRIELQWKQPAAARVRVLDPKGRPAAGAQVSVLRLTGASHVDLPEIIRRVWSTTTAADGIAHFAGISADDLDSLAIVTKEWGEQRFISNGVPAAIAEVRLAATSKVRIRFVDPPSPFPAKLRVVCEGGPEIRSQQPPFILIQRRFDAPAARDMEFQSAVGHLRVRPLLPPGESLRPSTQRVKVVSGATTDVAIRFAKATPVCGRVLEVGNNRPVAHARVILNQQSTGAASLLTTNEHGEYFGYVPPGEYRRQIVPPAEFVRWTAAASHQSLQRIFNVPAQDAPLELELAKLERGGEVAGTVVDATGKPAPGSTVLARYRVQEGASFHFETRHAGADERANFTLRGLPSSEAIQLFANRPHRGEFYKEEVSAVIGDRTLRLAVDASFGFSPRFQVLDERGQPVVGATLRGEWRDDASGFEGVLLFDQGRFAATDFNGRYQTINSFDRRLRYRFHASAPGFVDVDTDWIAGSTATVVLKPRRVSGLAGKVIDRRGAAVANAVVRFTSFEADYAAKTNLAGEFAFANVASKRGLLAARAAGFAAGGAIADDSKPTTVVLRRFDEPPADSQPRLNQQRDERQYAFGKEIAAPYVNAVWASRIDREKAHLAQSYADVDVESVLGVLDTDKHLHAESRDRMLYYAAVALAAANAPDAIRLADAIADPSSKSMAFARIARALGPKEKTGKLDCLSKAVIAGRSVPNASYRVAALSAVAVELAALGNRPAAMALLEECKSTASALPNSDWPGYAKGRFAENLALVDAPAARALIADYADVHSHARHHGNMAHNLAAFAPADAERALAGMNPTYAKDNEWLARVCHRMAPVDLPRAIRLAETTKNVAIRVRSLTVIAAAIAPKHPAKANELIEQAFAALESTADAPADERFQLSTGCAAIAQLPEIARIAPRRFDEFLWRAMLLPLHGSRESDLVSDYVKSRNAVRTTAVALILGHFESALGKALVADELTSIETTVALLSDAQGRDRDLAPRWLALAFFDPERFRDIAAKSLVVKNAARGDPIGNLRLQVAVPLMRDPDKRLAGIVERWLHQWPIGKEDI